MLHFRNFLIVRALFCAVVIMSFYACSDGTESEEKATKVLQERARLTPEPSDLDGNYSIDRERSSLQWKCGDDEGVVQSGTFKFTSTSEFSITDGLIETGRIDVDIRSLEIDYLPNWAASKLAEELLSPLFLDGGRHPYAMVTLYKSKAVGDALKLPLSLWMAGEQKFLTLNADMKFVSETEVVFRSTTTLDRTEFGMVHRTGEESVANAPSLSIIDDEVSITLEVYASVITS
ncbi:MAG: YceI family protein [Flavobacteriales bacterium]